MPYQRSSIPIVYRLTRGFCRCAFWLLSRDVRLLNAGMLEKLECAFLVIDRSAGLLPALALACAFDERVQSLFPASPEPRSFLEKLLAWALRIERFDASAGSGQPTNHAAVEAARSAGIVAVFMRNPRGATSNAAARADFVAELAAVHPLGPEILPVHWLSPAGIRGPEFIYIGHPFRGGSAEAEASAVAGSLKSGAAENVFALESRELESFSHTLEEVLREGLREEWRRVPGRRQSADEMVLSGFIRRWMSERNRTDPGFLISLRESTDRCREARRQFSLQCLRVDAIGPWSRSPGAVALAWTESVLGFPVALFGLVNHLPIAAVMFAAELFKQHSRHDPKTQWLLRIFVVLGFYALQTWLIDLWLGRAAAGWYALLLPVTGAYLWRYRWLLNHRSYPLALKISLPLVARAAARQQKDVAAKLDREVSRYSPHWL